ncbi:MAG: Inosine-5'-monophosphate dehydrogenase [Syntrophorhabdus sp. PtaU1.Bin058]|nr:MAG: Inosine-5'-monophosphate dehydrogenase [Syntrophorhabdus sp. PtaU1.Bin058]
MLVKDIMVYNVITIPSDTYVLDAERIMEFHRIGRLPVIDKGKLVGLVTKDDLLKASPSSTTPYNQRQLFYLMSKLTVKEIMKTNVVTVTPDTTIEKAVALAQKNRVGCLPVVDDGRVLGIITTNDVFYKILNPLLGIGEAGKRIIIYGAGAREESQKVMEQVIKSGLKVKTCWTPPDPHKNDLVLHFDTDDVTALTAELKALGYEVAIREHTA